MIKPNVIERSKDIDGFQKPIISAMENILGHPVIQPSLPRQASESGRGRCHLCCVASSSKKEKINKLSKTTMYVVIVTSMFVVSTVKKSNICFKCNMEPETD